MSFISKNDINKFGSYNDRENSYDDEKELNIMKTFLEKRFDKSFKVIKKPYGPYDVDIGVFDSENNLKFVVDIERWRHWKNDWPQNYRYLSFLERKNKFLKYDQFFMVYFNYDLTKFVRVEKSGIMSVEPEKRYTQGKYDMVRKVPFNCGKLYGNFLGNFEKSIFEHEICDILK